MEEGVGTAPATRPYEGRIFRVKLAFLVLIRWQLAQTSSHFSISFKIRFRETLPVVALPI